ncbi:hypothetical protein PIB30_072970 [Stylosanthes scabra]|uniref:Uncharacterized protein n=1 Tax=Stylosanthes scabra TaxID=79078 RepID=A0ABU6SQG1_9FABA|nr:hypothetical protein [Stylosanthes scabra]
MLRLPFHGDPRICAVGKYSTDEHLDREDAAASMITTLLAKNGQHVDDYNYDQIEPTLVENADLRWELGDVKSHYHRLHNDFIDFKRAVNPDLVQTSDND